LVMCLALANACKQNHRSLVDKEKNQ
jgi:hypothetical protein